ncbi:hypothetical protein BHE74_00005009 [Ensete ventricosum]|nr:hypothetical protein BHE74_00005009 [Ensete ventricosum]RZR90890.1 hypothetical protein BHM03_00018892 [Ensete ventricosum]
MEKAAIVADEGCGSDRQGVEEDELSAEELLARAKAEDGTVGQRRRCCARPRAVGAANDSVVVEAGAGGSRQLRSNSRGSRLRLKKRAVTVAEERR